MLDVEWSAGAEAAFDALPDTVAINVLHKLEIVEKLGVANEQKIGEIAAGWSIHLLYVDGCHIVCVADLRQYPSIVSITEIKGYTITDNATKQAFVSNALREKGIAAPNVQVF